jgi:formamidopyrimidine-DNA glycosylase
MPELPDVELYLSALRPRIVGRTLARVRLAIPFLLRSVDPPIEAAIGQQVIALRRLGKRIVWQFEDGELFFVFHLMIAGRFRWGARGAPVPRRVGLAAFDFAEGTLLLTEAATKKRASLYVVCGEEALTHHDPGGLEIMTAGPEAFARVLKRENHTLKRALTDPHLFSGIGNAYSDEILHRASCRWMRSARCMLRHVRPSESGRHDYSRRRVQIFRRRSQLFVMGWPFTDDTRSHAHAAVRRCSASCTETTR